jgi:hypothetical protein
MESQLKTQKQSLVVLTALLRLALLVGPEALMVKLLGNNLLICSVACLIVLGLWLSVDVWPFRPATVARAAAKPEAVSYAANFTKMPWWNSLFLRLVLFVAIIHSKM